MKKILVIQTAFPGDAILTLPMIQKLHEIYENVKVDVISIPATEAIFNSSPFVENVLVLDKKGSHKSIFSLYKFSKNLAGKYDKIISPHRSLRSSLIVLFSKIKDSVGFNKANLSFIYKKTVKYNNHSHEVKRNLDLLGIDTSKWKIKPVIECSSDKTLLSDLKALTKEKNVVAVAPGTVWETKRYPEEYFKEIINSLIHKGFYVFLTGGKNEKRLCENISKSFDDNIRVIAGDLSIPETVELYKKCKLVISNDSAPTHMAMAADVNVITIYCSTVPEFGFYPYSDKSIIISDNSEKCKPCGIHGHKSCPEKHFRCGLNLKPSEVLSKIDSLKLL